MTFWIKGKTDGRVIKLRDGIWRNKIYAATTDDPSYVSAKIAKNEFVSSVRHAYKRADIQQKRVQKVLEIELRHANKTRHTAEALEGMFQNPLTFKMFNVDVLPEQTYFYEKEIFPLGLVQVETSGDQITNWKLVDQAKSVDYKLPELKILSLDIVISSKVPRFDSRLVEMSLSDSASTITYKGNESEIIEKAHDEIIRTNPDFIVTRNGDLFVLPYLNSKAQRLGVDFNLNRDDDMKPSHLSSVQNSGTTFFSYGRILFKAKMQKLYGRVHLDEANTFVFDQCCFDGLFEIARLCRMPLHNSVRASIGKCLSSLQFYYASKKDILIPWKPWSAEDPKTFHELLIQDRGGLVLEPLPGIHEHVGEIDFSSLYPSIICKYNISAETLNCKCCKEIGHHIEGLDLHICTQENGIVAESLRLPLDKRFEYRQMRDSTNDKQQKKIYKRRADALKWILVTCLAAESPVLIKQNGVIQYTRIGKFIDNIVSGKEGVIDCPDEVSVAGVTYDFKSKFCKVKKLIRVPNNERLLKITMQSGREIIATPSHPFYLLKNGSLEVRPAEDLEEGNFIPVAKKLPSLEENEEHVDAISRLTELHDTAELGKWRV